jgi:hypothetical protein
MQMLKISTCLIALLTLSLFIVHTGCKKEKIPDDPMKVKLPPPTQEGLNTFGCLINGVPFVPTKINGLIIYPEKLPLLITYDFRRKMFGVVAQRYSLKENEEWMRTRISIGASFDQEGIYIIPPETRGLQDTSSICGLFKFDNASPYYLKFSEIVKGTTL